MAKWEYMKLVTSDSFPKVKIRDSEMPFDNYMDYLGRNDWELVSAVSTSSIEGVGDLVLFFKHQVGI